MKIVLYIVGIVIGLGFLFTFACLLSYVRYMSAITKARKREEEAQTKLLQEIAKFKNAERKLFISAEEETIDKDVTINLN